MAKKNKLVATVFSAALITSAIAAPALAADVTPNTSAPTVFAANVTSGDAAGTTQPTATTTQNAASVVAQPATLPGVTTVSVNPDGTIAITENGNTSSITKASWIERILNFLFK